MSITPPHSDTEKFVDSVYNYSSATDPVDKNKFNFFFASQQPPSSTDSLAMTHFDDGSAIQWYLLFFKYDFDTLNLVLLPKVLKTKFGWFIA